MSLKEQLSQAAKNNKSVVVATAQANKQGGEYRLIFLPALSTAREADGNKITYEYPVFVMGYEATPNHINGFRRYEVSRDDCVSEITWFKKAESQWEILRKGW